jgi:peptidylprolyl isomerase
LFTSIHLIFIGLPIVELEYVEIPTGTGTQASAGKTIRVHYTGKFPCGKVFDSSISRGEPIEFVLG